MNNKYSIQTLFPTPVYVSKLDIDLKPYIDLSLKEEHIKISNNTSHRKDHSLKSKSSFVLEEKKYIYIKNEIIKHINTYTKNILKCTNSFRITTSWFTYTNPGDESYIHRHRNSVFSGVVYLQCSKDSGNITFETFS